MSDLPSGAGMLAEEFQDMWDVYAQLGFATAPADPLTGRERRLVKLALSIGAGSEGSTHSHTRRDRPGRIDGVRPAWPAARGRCDDVGP